MLCRRFWRGHGARVYDAEPDSLIFELAAGGGFDGCCGFVDGHCHGGAVVVKRYYAYVGSVEAALCYEVADNVAYRYLLFAAGVEVDGFM